MTSMGFHAGQLQLMERQFAQRRVWVPTHRFHPPRALSLKQLKYEDLSPDAGLNTTENFVAILSVYLQIILISALFLTLGTSDFKKTEWDLEWLVTLPLTKKLLMSLRILERTVGNPILLLAILPPMVLLFLKIHFPLPGAVLAGILSAIPILILAATLQTILDTGVRLHWKPARIKNLQAATNVTGAALFYLISLSRESVSGFLLSLRDQFYSIFAWTPLGLWVQSLFRLNASLPFILFLLESAILGYLGFVFLLYLLRDGVVSGSGQVSVRGGSQISGKPARTRRFSYSWFSPFTLREFKLLIRDHQYLTQTVVTPILILLLQVYFLWKSKGHLFTEPRSGAAVAFGMAGYSMMSSCYLCLVIEGPALWIFYTLPRSLRSLLFEKVSRWGWVASVYVLLFFIWCANQPGRIINFEFLSAFAMALVGIPILVVIATSLGVLGYEGPSATPQRRMKASSTYVYLLSLVAYVACIFLPDFWMSLIAVIMMILVAAAFWQKAEERLPYLLDPASIPPPKVSFGDGLIAAQVFFILQNLFTLIQVNRPAPLSGLILTRSFILAGFLTWLGMQFYYRSANARDRPLFFCDKLANGSSLWFKRRPRECLLRLVLPFHGSQARWV